MPLRDSLLLVSASAGHQARHFRRAAERLGLSCTLVTEASLAEGTKAAAWGEDAVDAVQLRFGAKAAQEALSRLKPRGPFRGVVASGDRSARLAAEIAAGLGLPFHPLRAAAICMDKYEFKKTLADAGLPVPWFQRVRLDSDEAAVASLARRVRYPCVLKPLIWTSGRGVIRAGAAADFGAAFARVRQLLQSAAAVQADPNAAWVEIETFIPGPQFALEGWMAAGELRRFALFDKYGSLDGPFFADGKFLTPSRHDPNRRAMIWDLVEAAARAARLGPGPVHAEIRIGPAEASMEAGTPVAELPPEAHAAEVPAHPAPLPPARETAYVLQLAARPIAGWRSRALRFRREGSPELISLEELLIRGAVGEPLGAWEREEQAAGVLMIPVPNTGVLEQVEGTEAASRVPGVEAVEITAVPSQALAAPPEAESYVGCILARGSTSEAVEESLHTALGKIQVRMRTTPARAGH